MITGILITLLAVGFFILSYDRMSDVYEKIISKVKSWLLSFKEIDLESIKKGDIKAGDKAWEHIRELLSLTFGLASEKAVKLFIAFSAVLAALDMMLLSGRVNTRVLVLSMIIMLILPYCFLRMRLEKLRVKSSREGEILITEVLNSYRINYFNMREAIEKAALNIEEAPQSKRLLFNLSKGLNRAGTAAEIKHFTDEFSLSLNTSWGKILADSLYISLTKGTKVDDAISDLSKTILKARKIDEYSKRQNNETKLIFKYLVPLAFIGTVFGAIGFFGMSFSKYLYYQFETEVGLNWFMISIITYAIGILVNGFISRTKLDF